MLKLRILIVDDSVSIRELVKDAFEKRGFRVLTAADGQEALEVTLKETPDIIISDISMPGLDGWDFCDQVRKNPYTSFIPFVFLSKKTEAPDRIKGLQMGADDYLTKPFEMEELVARVELILNRTIKAQEAAYSKSKGLSGSTKEMSLPDLLQLFNANRKTGILKIRKSSQVEGFIAFRDGNIVGAQLNKFSPVKAVQRMLQWDDAKFELEPLLGTSGDYDPELGSIESILLESFRIQDELARLRQEKPVGGVQLVSEALRNLGGLDEKQKKVLVRARSANHVNDLMEIEDISDLEVYETVLELMDRGILKGAG